jgi:hypothetical protein
MQSRKVIFATFCFDLSVFAGKQKAPQKREASISL